MMPRRFLHETFVAAETQILKANKVFQELGAGSYAPWAQSDAPFRPAESGRTSIPSRMNHQD